MTGKTVDNETAKSEDRAEEIVEKLKLRMSSEI